MSSQQETTAALHEMGSMFQQTLFWMFVPSIITSVLTKIYKTVIGKRRASKYASPSASTRLSNRIYLFVVASYLIYSIAQVEHQLPGNLYHHLRVEPLASDNDIKSSYRKLSRVYHPDKVMDQPADIQEQMGLEYLHIQKAYETLKHPTKKMAYDKFGASSLDCSFCRNEKDFLMNSLLNVALFYSTTISIIGLTSFLGTAGFGTFWRLTGLLGVATVESMVLMCKDDPLSHILGWRTPHEKMIIIRQCSIALFIAMSQMGPILFPKKTFKLKQSLLGLEELSHLVLNEAKNAIKSSFEPYSHSPQIMGELQRKMEKLAVDIQLQRQETEESVKAKKVK